MTRNKNTSVVSRAAVQETVSAALRRRIGPGALSYAEVAEALDCDARAVKGWVLGDCTPRMAEFIRLCAFFGPEFASETLAPAGLKARAVEASDICEHELNADVAQ